MLKQHMLARRLGSLLLVAFLVSAASGQTGLGVAEHETYGAHLVDGEGASLYVFLQDEQEDGSACHGECIQSWPPFMTDDSVEPSGDVDASLVGTIDRADEGQQVTYNGWPLYFSAADEEVGDANGHGPDGEWSLLSPSGRPISIAEENVADAGGDGGEGVASWMAKGRELYETTARPTPCAACHGIEGEGGSAPPIEGSRLVENSRRLLIRIVHGGQIMPAFGNSMTDEEIAAVASYTRNSFGFDLGEVTEEEVKEVR